MSDQYAPVHHITTSDTPVHHTHDHSNATSTTQQPDTIEPVKQVEPVQNIPPRDNVTDLSQVDSNDAQARRASLAPTPNPTAPQGTVTTSEASASEIPPYSTVGEQNAPGTAGVVGENAMAAFGYGGSKVERPKEDQGLGEKIVNFLGA